MSTHRGGDAFAERAKRLLQSCESDAPDEALLATLTEDVYSTDPDRARGASRAILGIFVEGLSDAFEPQYCEIYARLFARVVAAGIDGLHAEELTERYRRIRRPRHPGDIPGNVDHVYVLSRVSLGADVAVTSVVLDAAKKKFPDARVRLVGPRKNWELFAGDPSIGHTLVDYDGRADLRARLSVWSRLRALASEPNAVVIDPDSRLTQLGLLPIGPEERYFFFESRSAGGDGNDSLYVLVQRWLEDTFAVSARPFIAPLPPPSEGTGDTVSVSLGVGGNLEKRIDDPFESKLLAMLAERGRPVVVDVGAGGGEEERRVDAAARATAAPCSSLRTRSGSFASFAALIRESSLYVGYDSAGQHVAAVSGVPALIVFAGYPSLRMFSRWRPVGGGPIEIVRVDDKTPHRVFELAADALNRLPV